ncbi:MAG: toll/interleukin-1 receptor domain-containing protein [Saprospiraceae bacterium]
MLRIYISYAPADSPYLATLLQWLRPLQEKYFLEVWHHPKPLQGSPELYYREAMLNNLEQAHIYLFLTSNNSLKTAHIAQEELPRAIARHAAHGDKYVRLLPVVLSPTGGKNLPVLAAFKPIGGGKPLSDWKTDDAGYRLIASDLQHVIEELRRNWMEEYHRLDMPLDDFAQYRLPPPPPPTLQPIPGWAGALMLLIIFYMVTSWYLSGCAPRMYHMYVPKSMPYQSLPEQYFRENPVNPPEEVPKRPEE